MPGADLKRIGRQIEATRQRSIEEGADVDQQPADARGRKRRISTDTALRMPPHNDGFAFGDHALDHLFLFSARSAAVGGQSFVVGGLAVLDILAKHPGNTEMVTCCRTVDIDHSEPNFPQEGFSPIVRTTPAGRPQVRHHPPSSPRHGSGRGRVVGVRRALEGRGDLRPRPRRPVPAGGGRRSVHGQLPVLHGRHAHTDPARTLYSIWAWSSSAVAVPAVELDIVNPQNPAQLAG